MIANERQFFSAFLFLKDFGFESVLCVRVFLICRFLSVIAYIQSARSKEYDSFYRIIRFFKIVTINKRNAVALS